VAGITFVHLRDAFVYLSVLLDAFSRKVIGWCFEDHIDAALALAALDQAILTRCPTRKVSSIILIEAFNMLVPNTVNDWTQTLRPRIPSAA
jgi:transposase InsO family protein